MNIINNHDCFGCGVCAIVCPKCIIKIELNKDGFYEPRIEDVSQCSDCGLCVDVCSWSHDDLALKEHHIKSWAAWSNDPNVRMMCSSGGVGFEVGKVAISKGYKVCGVKYNVDSERAEHYVAVSEAELLASVGSKYIQSYTVDGFLAIDKKGKYLVTGTPCQIDSFRRYIQKFHCENNFVLLDFFCHGVPSMFVWQKYLEEVKNKIGRISSVSWRNKTISSNDGQFILPEDRVVETVGWHNSYNIRIEGESEKKFYSMRSEGDNFYRLFLSNTCLGKACYEKCRFKYNKSSADIRIGDLWGNTYQNNEDGVSAAISFTVKGEELLKQSNCYFVEHPFEVVAEGQMKKMPVKTHIYFNVIRRIRHGAMINEICQILDMHEKYNRLISRIKHPFRSMRNMLKRLGR